MAPFIIFSLPRSRSVWTKNWLWKAGLEVGHDAGIECANIAEFLGTFDDGMQGSCETGSMFAWKLFAAKLPGIRFATIRRNRVEVLTSLARFGLDGLEDELAERDALLDEIEAQPGVLRIEYPDLWTPQAAQRLLAHCAPDIPFDQWLWARCAAVNTQLDMEDRLAKLAQNHDSIERLKTEARAAIRDLALSRGYTIGLEPWDKIWPEAKVLAAAHSHEVDDGVEPNRPHRVAERDMAVLNRSGFLRLFALRDVDGVLLGYLTWQVMGDLESEGLTIAQQGAWYVAPGHGRAAHDLFTQSLCILRLLGVQLVFPHHRAQGRGQRIGRFFSRLGAKKIQETYSLWIGK